jgi:glycosyltransferase involved in cell wall biosynthesis
MRIAYVCSDRGVPVFGTKGASVHVRELCRALAAVGHEVLIVSPRAGGAPPAGFEPEVAELRLAPEDEAACSFLADDPAAGPAAAREVGWLVYSAALRSRLASLLRDFGADVVYERYSLLATAGASAARELGVPHILEVNAPLSAEQSAHRGQAFAYTTRKVETALLHGADRIVAVSRGVAEWLAAAGVDPGRVTVLANAVDPARFRVTSAERAATRARLGLDGVPVVGFLGTLKPWHDVQGLIRATASLAGAGMRLRLLVIGEGPERPQLESLARSLGIGSITTFVGAVAHDDVPRYLAGLDVAAVTYDALPGFYFSPLKLFEYLAAGVPVVAADVGDIAHCVHQGRTGLLYAPGNVAALSEALLELLVDPARALRLAAAGREHVFAEHTWTGNALRVTALAAAAARERAEELACV